MGKDRAEQGTHRLGGRAVSMAVRRSLWTLGNMGLSRVHLGLTQVHLGLTQRLQVG